MEQFEVKLDELQDLVIFYGLRLIFAVAALVIGLWVIRILVNQMSRVMARRQVDPSLLPFLRSVINIALKAALIVTVIGMVGIEMTSFVAILGAASLAVGLALQGTLQNFAGGVMILLFKPFKIGDFVEAQGFSGVVKEIQIFNTLLTTVDNRVIIIPNGSLANSSMINHNALPTRRVDLAFRISHGDDFAKAKQIITNAARADGRILKDPEPFVRIGELAPGSVNITVRLWVKTEDYWPAYFDMMEMIKMVLDKEGLSAPVPQMNIRVDKTI